MKRYSPLKKYLVNKLHRNEAIWKTKKAQKAQLMISLTIATMLSLQLLISVANAKPMILTFENSPLVGLPTGIAAESPKAPLEAQDEAKDGGAAESGKKVIVTTYNAEVGQTDADPLTMASGKKVYEGAVASNCHPLGSKVKIKGLGEMVVEDRMNKRYTKDCGTENERIDVFKWNRADNFKKTLEYERI
jgi:3D (Asp-Asp-Asp) domain-containing protein